MSLSPEGKNTANVHSCNFSLKTGYVIIAVVWLFVSSICFAAEPVIMDFESGTIPWHSQAETITVSRKKGTGAIAESSACMNVSGSLRSGVYYAVSDACPVDGFRHYRINVWMRIDRMYPKNYLPSLKCEYLTSDPNSSLGFAEVTGYNTARAGEWQLLTGEFRAPGGTVMCRLVLDTGSTTLMEAAASKVIDVSLDDITIEPIERYTIEGQYYLNPIPASLEKVRGVHPRLYINEARIKELREKIKTTHAHIFNKFRLYADKLASQGPPEYRSYDDGRLDEQWWQVPVGNALPILALAHVLTGEQRYLDSVREWALASCNYPTWGTGWGDGLDCIAGHHLYGLGLVYDWCHDSLDSETLDVIRSTLTRRTQAMFEAAAHGAIVPGAEEYRVRPWPEWDEAYLQNHLWVNTSGMAIAGLSLFDEVDEASRWIGFPLDRYRRTMKYLGPDGASHEGINYWSYGMEHLLKFMCLARDLLDEDMFGHEWFRNTAAYRLHMSLPHNAWAQRNTTINYGDSYRKDSYGPDYQLRFLAGEYRDGCAQWLAQELNRADVLFPGSEWFNLIWYNPSIEAKPPYGRPTLCHFTDMDFVTARSDWSGDESLVFFKCGPYIGHHAIHEMPYCPSSAHHVHPDVNHFVLFGAGEWLIRDNENQGKYTGQHNTLLINGGEQYGGGGSMSVDGGMQVGGGGAIFDAVELHGMKVRPRIIRAVSTPGFDQMTGDAAEAYPKEAGLKRFIRHMLFVKPDVLIVVDDIELTGESDLELRFIPEQQEAEHDGNTLFMRGEKAALRFEQLTGAGIDLSTETLTVLSRRGTEDSQFTIRVRTHKAKWRNAAALSWSKADKGPVQITLNKNENLWNFHISGRTVVLNWNTGEAELRQ